MIDLGDRKIRVVATPGHMPDAVCLYDKQSGYLWCGDSFYEGPMGTLSSWYKFKAFKMADFARTSTLLVTFRATKYYRISCFHNNYFFYF